MPEHDTHHRHQAKVLVADDDMNVRLLTRKCLESEGMDVIEAPDGHAALDSFMRERPDLVFLDVEMPGMTGLEVCRRIRAMPQGENIPIMIVTGSDDRKSIDDGFEAGATQYKTKNTILTTLHRLSFLPLPFTYFLCPVSGQQYFSPQFFFPSVN